MKKPSFWSRVGDFLTGKGFYMVLLLCVAAIGGTGYYLYHLATAQPALTQVSSPVQVEAPDETLQEVPASGTEELPASPTEETAAAAEASGAEKAFESPDAAEAASQPEKPAKAADAEPKAEEAAAPAEPAKETAAEVENVPCLPVSGPVVEAFSATELTYNPALADWRTHNGVDLAAEPSEDVVAALDGEVLSVSNDPVLGMTVVLNHGDGLQTSYSNLADPVPVRSGEAVKAGTVIGTVGDTAAGESHEGQWLHFAVKQDGEIADPMAFLGVEK